MWPSNETMWTFETLSCRDKIRVTRFLTKGKAPVDRQLAAAAVELAEGYQQQNQTYTVFNRWAPVFTAVILSVLIIPGALAGDLPMAIAFCLVALSSIAYIMLDPVARPNNVARSLEASRQVIGSVP